MKGFAELFFLVGDHAQELHLNIPRVLELVELIGGDVDDGARLEPYDLFSPLDGA